MNEINTTTVKNTIDLRLFLRKYIFSKKECVEIFMKYFTNYVNGIEKYDITFVDSVFNAECEITEDVIKAQEYYKYIAKIVYDFLNDHEIFGYVNEGHKEEGCTFLGLGEEMYTIYSEILLDIHIFVKPEINKDKKILVIRF